MKFINKYLRNIRSYKVASHKIWDVTPEERKNILKLDWNEATIPPSPNVKKALFDVMKDEHIYNLYPAAYSQELTDLLSGYSGIEKEYIQYFASSDTLHEYLVRMFVGVGDPILILGPTYDNFRLTCESQGAQVYYYDYKSDFSLDKEVFLRRIEEVSPSLIYICNPNNPTGNLLQKDFLLKILEQYPDTIMVLDEAYYEFSGFSMSGYVKEYDNLFITRTFSKAFALANFRAGYLISHKENIHQISKIRNPKNFTTFSQVAVIEALKDLKYMKDFVAEVLKAKVYFQKELNKLSFIDRVFESQGNYLLIKFRDKETKTRIFDLLSENDIYVRNLTHSDLLDKCLRITIGTTEQMKRVIDVIKQLKA